jgi:hypothetical protein
MLNNKNKIHDKELIEYFKTIGFPLLYIFKKQTPDLCKEAIKQKYYTIYGIKNIKFQTNELCELAVENDGMSLEFVINQTEKICEKAVKQNGLALQFVKNKNYKLCFDAVTQNSKSLKYVDFNDENYDLYFENYKNIKNKNEVIEICSICLSNDKNKYCEITECKHSFHIKCLIQWVKENNTCPICRIIIL